MSGKCCTTQTYNTAFFDAVDDGFCVESTFFHESFASIDAFFPFIAFYIDDDSRSLETCGIDSRIYFGDSS